MSQAIIGRQKAGTTAFAVLGAISFCHFLNDLAQSLLPAIYPILKGGFDLSFGQIGLLTLIYQGVASLLQPVVGLFTDRRPQPYSLPFGMGCTLLGLLTLAFAPNFAVLLAGGALLGHRLVDLPSGILADRAAGLGRRARLGAIAVPGRRQFRHLARPAARGVLRPAARTGAASPGSRSLRSPA